MKHLSGGSLERYRTPPKKVFRRLGLGVIKDGHVKVIAGFRFKWWVPDFLGPVEPLIVNARILRMKPVATPSRPTTT